MYYLERSYERCCRRRCFFCIVDVLETVGSLLRHYYAIIQLSTL
jgi:hypothetical protein